MTGLQVFMSQLRGLRVNIIIPCILAVMMFTLAFHIIEKQIIKFGKNIFFMNTPILCVYNDHENAEFGLSE